MGKILAYLHPSTDEHDRNQQHLEILEYARQLHLYADAFVEIPISSKRPQRTLASAEYT